MADKKYVEKISNGEQDLYIRDAEAKEAIGGLGELSRKDSATGVVTAAGTNASSAVSLSGEVKQKMVTKDIKEVDSFSAGTSPSLSYDETSKKLTFSAGSQSSLTTKNTTVASGAVSAEGTGAEVVTQSNNTGTADAQVFTGAAVNVTVS